MVNLNDMRRRAGLRESEESWVFTMRAEDGTYDKVFPDQATAMAELVRQLGRNSDEGMDEVERPLRPGRTYHDDWGRSMRVSKGQPGDTPQNLAAIRDAYDARETGQATPEQIALLARHGH